MVAIGSYGVLRLYSFMHACNCKVKVMPGCAAVHFMRLCQDMYIILMHASIYANLCFPILASSFLLILPSILFTTTNLFLFIASELGPLAICRDLVSYSISAIALAAFYTDSPVHPLQYASAAANASDYLLLGTTQIY